MEVRWKGIAGPKDPAWRTRRCLYAYLAPDGQEVLYVGKAWGKSTVRSRWNADDKDGFWDDLEQQRDIHKHVVLVGRVSVGDGDRLTNELLLDSESLLIYRVKPWGNIQAKESRIRRPGLRVRSSGDDWPGPAEVRDQ